MSFKTDTHDSPAQQRGVARLDRSFYPARAESSPQTTEVHSLSLRGMVEACFRHRTRLFLVAGFVFALVVTAAFLLPKRYEANMQLIVLNAREDSMISPAAGEFAQPPPQITIDDLNSQAALLKSHDVLSDALDRLGMPSTPTAARDEAVARLDKQLDVDPIRDSDLVDVSYVSSSPREAKQVLQAVASSYMDKQLALRRPVRSREVFQQLVNADRDQLTSAQAALANFKISTGIASLPEDEAILLRQLESASTQSAAASAELAEMRRRAARTQTELAEHPARVSTQTRATPNQVAVEDLTVKLVSLENDRTALLERYQPTERNVVEVQKQIDTVKAEIARQQSTNAMETTTDINPVAQTLRSELAEAQITGAALSARQRALQREDSTYSQQLNTLEQRRAAYQALQSRVDEAQKNYDVAVQKRDQTGFEDALDRERIANVAFAADPSASSIPVAPKPAIYLLVGLFTSLFLGIGSCILSDMTRSVVYSPAELDAITGVMTLGTVPLDPSRRTDRSLLEKKQAEGGVDTPEPTLEPLAYLSADRSVRGEAQ